MFLLIIKLTPSSNMSFMVLAVKVYMKPDHNLCKNYSAIRETSYLTSFTAISRIASLKEIIIPYLELLGNLILARLMNSVKISMKKEAKIDNVYYSADSKLRFSWINSQTF